MLFPFNPFYAGYGNRVNVLNHYWFCESENVLNLKNFIDFVGCLGVQGCGNPNLQDIYNQSTRRTKVRSNAILSIFVSLKPPVYLYYWTLTSVQIHLQKKKNSYCSLFFNRYSKQSFIVDLVFPPFIPSVHEAIADTEYNDFSYWRPEPILPDEAEASKFVTSYSN